MQQMRAVAPARDPSMWSGHIILCGLGRIGVGVAETLLRAGSRLVVVDNGPATPFRRDLEDHGVPVIHADSTQTTSLRQAGIDGAAVVVVTISHDLTSLKTALAARELNPTARVVMRLFNLRMAEHLRNLPAGIIALSLSATVAPMFALAARNRYLTGAFVAAGSIWALGSLGFDGQPGLTMTCRQWRRLGVVVLASTVRDSTTWFPDADDMPPNDAKLLVATEPGRLLLLGGHPDLIAPAHAADNPATWLDARPLHRRLLAEHRSTALTRSWRVWRRANRIFRVALVAQLLLLCCSVVIFHFFYPLPVVDAVYFTAALITTVGLGDINLLHASAELKVFGVIVMLGGAILMAAIYALVAEFVVSQRIDALVGARIDEMNDHYVVAGLGTVGFRVISALREAGERVIAVDVSESARFVPQLRALGVPVVVGDIAFEDTLRRAQIERAHAFIAVTSNDLVNIEAALNARALQPDGHVVLRVFDHELAVQARHSLKIPASFSASELGAPAMAGAAIGHEAPSVVHVPLDHPGAEGLTITHLRATRDNALIGRTLDDIALANAGAVLLHGAADRGGRVDFAPPLDVVLADGDLVVLAQSGYSPVFPAS